MAHKVLLRRCTQYDPKRISQIIQEGMDELGVRPHGRTMVKPNCVIAHPRYYANAFTRPEFLDGLLDALRALDGGMTELSVGERCGITIPTRYAFAEAGYRPVLRRHRVRVHYFDEMPQVVRPLTHPQALRSFIYVPQAVDQCEFLVNAPKFKAHPWTKVTFALKNFIGIQDDNHRLIDHDHELHTKVVDLQEVITPSLIAIDGITAGQKTMLTPTPFPLGLIIMGINPVAVDAVCSRVVRLDPNEVDHIRIAHDRGLGPVALSEIELGGDVTLEQAQELTTGFQLSLDRVERIFNGERSGLETYAGPPPEPEKTDYCWGGCPGALYEAMQVIQAIQPEVYQEVRPVHMVFGAYEGPIPAQADERVIFVGDCVRYQGEVCGRAVEIPSVYRFRDTINPHQATSGDLLAKVVGYLSQRLRVGRNQIVRIRGCPVSVAENIFWIADFGHTKLPYLAPDIVFKFAYHYTIMRIKRFWNQQIRGPRPKRLPRGRVTQRAREALSPAAESPRARQADNPPKES
jgi:uncharacterized protein (DUF362 family)